MELYPYQVEDIAWLKERPRSILGSEMGTGKTIIFLDLCKQLEANFALVVCPKSLIAEWEYQAEEWLGKKWLKEKLAVINYEKLRNGDFANLMSSEPWDIICFDECHKLKNPKTKQTNGAFMLCADQSQRVVLMSGTPMQNGPQDLFPLLKIISPLEFTSYWAFIEKFCVVQRLPQPPFPRVIVGAKNKEELRKLLHTKMKRRTKKEVLPDLPDKVFRTLPVVLGKGQESKYLQMEDELFVLLDSGEKVTAPAVIAQRMRLRQLCLEPNLLSEENKVSSPSAKTQAILEIIEESKSVDADGKETIYPVVVYTYFEQYTRILSSELTKAKISHALYTGKVDADTRSQVVRDFQKGKYRVLIGTITTMGLGLTLTASSTVIFADWWYNPAVNDQAIDRLHRIGQTNSVEVIDLWVKGTIEDAMHRVVKRKRKMFDDIVATEEAAIEELRAMRKERQHESGRV